MIAAFTPYIKLLRIDHWVKNIFVFPGTIIAIVINNENLKSDFDMFVLITLGFFIVCISSSANYIINEWLDRKTDIYNPEKSNRVSIKNKLKPAIIYLIYFFLISLVCTLSFFYINNYFLLAIIIFLLIGLAYNANPLRLKNITFIDVIVEAFNNPIRLYLGWVLILPEQIPPFSLLISFWLGGCFLMNSKRLQEYLIAQKENTMNELINYRISFKNYTYENLLFTNVLYSILSYGALTIFLAKWRIEYIFILPFIAVLFSYYFIMCINLRKEVRRPEKIYKNWRFYILISIIGVSFTFLSIYDVIFIQYLFDDTILFKIENQILN